MFDWLFDIKWKRRYEKHRDKIEEMGYDEWIKSPLDLSDIPIITNTKALKAMMEEAEAYIKLPKSEWS